MKSVSELLIIIIKGDLLPKKFTRLTVHSEFCMLVSMSNSFMKPKRLIVISALIITGIIIMAVFRLNGNRLSGAPDNIFLISINTIRADHLSCYGYQHKTTPNIDAFADNAV